MRIVRFENVTRIYTSGDHELHALDSVDNKGKSVVILDPSEAGKSTLLNMLGGLDSSTSGKITMNSKDISIFNNNKLADCYASTIGFVFQFYNLIPALTVYENVTLVKEIAGNSMDGKQILAEVGLADHLKNFPSEFSRGEQQRVLIARALAKNPKILLCDGTTGALDSEMSVMSEAEEGKTMRSILPVPFLPIAVLTMVTTMYRISSSKKMQTGTLMVLSFRDKQISKLLITQNRWLTFIGATLDLPGDVGVIYILTKALVSEYELSLSLGPVTYIVSIALTFDISLFVGFMLSHKKRKLIW